MNESANSNGNLERLEQWARKVLDDSQRLPDDMSEDELREQQASWYADFFTNGDSWVVASPDDPAMREHLTVEEGLTSELADAVLAKMRERAASG